MFAALPEDPVLFLAHTPGSSQPPLTPLPGDMMHSSGHLDLQTHGAGMHACTHTCMHAHTHTLKK